MYPFAGGPSISVVATYSVPVITACARYAMWDCDVCGAYSDPVKNVLSMVIHRSKVQVSQHLSTMNSIGMGNKQVSSHE